MVAPDYSERRREVVVRLGLGRKRKVEEPAAPEPKPRKLRKALKAVFGEAKEDAGG